MTNDVSKTFTVQASRFNRGSIGKAVLGLAEQEGVQTAVEAGSGLFKQPLTVSLTGTQVGIDSVLAALGEIPGTPGNDPTSPFFP